MIVLAWLNVSYSILPKLNFLVLSFSRKLFWNKVKIQLYPILSEHVLKLIFKPKFHNHPEPALDYLIVWRKIKL